MLVRVRGQAASAAEVEWVSEYPTAPLTDYYTFGDMPETSEIGTVSLFSLASQDIDSIWSASRASNDTIIYANLGSLDTMGHWSREVDTSTSIRLTLVNSNLSSSWVRLNETDIAPRRQL